MIKRKIEVELELSTNDIYGEIQYKGPLDLAWMFNIVVASFTNEGLAELRDFCKKAEWHKFIVGASAFSQRLIRTCEHPDSHVLADICEGDAENAYTVQWCRICGAYRRNNQGEWRTPLEDEEQDVFHTKN